MKPNSRSDLNLFPLDIAQLYPFGFGFEGPGRGTPFLTPNPLKLKENGSFLAGKGMRGGLRDTNFPTNFFLVLSPFATLAGNHTLSRGVK